MSVQTSYFDRLWSLAAQGRSTGRNSAPDALQERLEADFATNKELFSAEEYEDPAFSECRRPEVLLLDKFSEQKITYLGYESGHKPSFPNVDHLPLLIRLGPLRIAPWLRAPKVSGIST